MKEDNMPGRNPHGTILSDKLNNEAAQNGALRRDEHTKYRMKYMVKTWRNLAKLGNTKWRGELDLSSAVTLYVVQIDTSV